MSITFGFYNSSDGDRKYNALQLSSIFDGIIVDGVFASIGTAFVVKATTGNVVNVGIGKAWFNHTWTLNDAILPLAAPEADSLYSRIDAIVIEVDASDSVRANDIKFVQGEPASNPQRPTLINNELVHQYPLCYINRTKGSSEISQADITNMVGTEATPFITGILQTVSLDELLGQWQDQLDQFVANETSDFNTWSDQHKAEFEAWVLEHESGFNTWTADQKTEYETWTENQQSDYKTWISNHKIMYDEWVAEQKSKYEAEFESIMADLTNEQQLLDNWIYSEKADFLSWYNEMKDQLSEDAAGNLQLQIDKEEIERILVCGFVDGTKTISEDGTTIISTASDGRVLTKTFTNNFNTITLVLTSADGAEIARSIKTLDSTGLSFNTTVTFA